MCTYLFVGACMHGLPSTERQSVCKCKYKHILKQRKYKTHRIVRIKYYAQMNTMIGMKKQGCRVLVFVGLRLQNQKKFRTPDSDFDFDSSPKKTRTSTPTTSPTSDSDSDSRTYCDILIVYLTRQKISKFSQEKVHNSVQAEFQL